MKYTALLLLSFVLMTSCSPSDDKNETGLLPDYYPMAENLSWTYNVSGTEGLSGRDSLYVHGDTVINSKTYMKFKTRDLPFGFYSNSINNNSLRKEGTKILLSGASAFTFSEELPIDLDLVDFVVFDANANENQQLDQVSGTLTQTYEGFPLKFDYILKTTATGSMPTYTAPDGTVYNDIKSVKTTLTLTITSEIALGLTIPVLPRQDVVNSTVFMAAGKGVVYTNTTIAYELSDIAVQLGIPQSFSQISEEFLDTFLSE